MDGLSRTQQNSNTILSDDDYSIEMIKNLIMKKVIFSIYFLVCVVIVHAQDKAGNRTKPFDAGWRFLKDTIMADAPGYNDSKWRTVNLPHDWSIEDLPNQKADTVSGPFSRSSIGKAGTGFTVGGTGWYRKKFVTAKAQQNKLVSIHFDGVYMNADVWLNGHHLGNHPYGYTAFNYDLTPYLKPVGQENVLAVRVRNEGKNSRWYSGSGIYRHVWLTVTDKVHVDNWGVYITTPAVDVNNATVELKTTVINGLSTASNVTVNTTIVSPEGKTVGQSEKALQLEPNKSNTDDQTITVSNPALWSVETPILYKAITEIKAGNKTIDHVETLFGIRSLQFDGQQGFLLNGKVVKLKGGCIHHDNGPLGAAAIDRAEERKIELLKKAGYNALRLSHNPVSQALLDACDRVGMLVVTDAFDMWEGEKLGIQNGYHLYFKNWWQKDIQSMILRDRNHPSIIMWGIGNEIWEAADTSGYRIAKQLADEVRRLDPTRAVTEAIILLPERIKHTWEEYQPHLANLDVDGYNYFVNGKIDPNQRDSATIHRYESEHARNPKKLFMATEYFPAAALENWDVTEKYPYVIGGFSWTAVDYIGEAAIGGPALLNKSVKTPKGLMSLMYFFKPESWPVFNSHCGDLDLIGNRKAASYYQNVVWRNSPVEMLVHRPLPDDKKELRSPWGFPDELKNWTWPGQEGKKIAINVYTRSRLVKLELNGKIIAEQTVPDSSITASFEIDYQPGTLIARGFDNGKETGSSTLSTTGKPVAVRLVADRSTIKADPNDLAYVSAEIIDEKGNVVPYVDDLEVTYNLTGNATVAGVGNGNPADMSSFQQNHKKVYQGRGLVIVRPKGAAGKIILKASAKGLAQGSIEIIMK